MKIWMKIRTKMKRKWTDILENFVRNCVKNPGKIGHFAAHPKVGRGWAEGGQKGFLGDFVNNLFTIF